MTHKLFNEQEVSLSTMTPKLFTEEEEANIATNINQQSILLTSNIGGKAIDRCSPHLKDPLREKSLNPLLSNPPKNPTFNVVHSKAKNKALEKKPTTEYSSPASSQRYLLSDSNSEEFIEKEIVPSVIVNEFSSKLEVSNFILRPLEGLKLQNVKVEETIDTRASSSTTTTTTTASGSRPQEQQVVVLRVSLHCKGCEGKVRKHISKMAGVTSFKTDLVNKKVTVIGDVTPLGVLNSISKVKNAQLWPSQPQAACY